MIITLETLQRFEACEDAAAEFGEKFPDGLDVSRLWGDRRQRAETWRMLLDDGFLRRYIGWAIGEGLLPARIVGDFREADLRRADLSGANLRGANLRWANLCEADLYRAEVRWANLRGADLRRANLRWANLCEADLSGANLRGANLRRADLSGATWNEATIWPEGFTPK